MRFEVSAETAAPLAEVWAWWTDYGKSGEESAVSHGFGTRGVRRVLEAGATRVVLAESVPLPFVGGIEVVRHEVRIDEDARKLHERTVEGAPFEAVWSFETTGQGGTRIRREVNVEEGPGRFLPAAMARPFAQRDLDHHVREFEHERKVARV